MATSDKLIRDQVSLFAAYHFILALVYLIIAAAIVVYAVIPSPEETSANNPQQLFLPLTGLFVCLILVVIYGVIGSGLMRMNNSARMGAVFFALFGIVGGIFAVFGTFAGGIDSLAPDWLKIVLIGLLAICIYVLTAVIDTVMLFFLLNRRVRNVFYGEESAIELSEEGSVASDSLAQEEPSPSKDEPIKTK